MISCQYVRQKIATKSISLHCVINYCVGLDIVRLLALKSTGSRYLLSDEISNQRFLHTVEGFLW